MTEKVFNCIFCLEPTDMIYGDVGSVCQKEECLDKAFKRHIMKHHLNKSDKRCEP